MWTAFLRSRRAHLGRIRLGGDRRGSVAIMFATGSVALMCLTGLVIDVGNVYTAKRALQGATDLAAIAASSDIFHATAAADANAVINAYQASEVTEVTPGIYTPDPTLSPSARFQPAQAQTANAVRVTMTHNQPLYFIDMFTTPSGTTSTPIVTQAIAAQTRVASFGIGTTVASFNGGIVNAILGAAVGGSVALSAIDYTALDSTQVDLFGLAKAIAVQLGQPGASYVQALSSTIPMTSFLAALQTVAPGAASQVQSLLGAAGSGANTVDLSKLLQFGPYANQLVSDPEPSVTATASVLFLLQAASEASASTHLISLSLNANIPGISAVTAMLTVSEPAQNSLIAIDPVGITIQTAQIRLYLDISLATAVSGGIVHLPLYLEVGYGSATLGSLSCNALDSSQTQVTLNVTPGLVNGWIGTVTAANMTNYSVEPTPTNATFLNLLGIATVTGRANAQIGNTTPVPVVFSATDIQNQAIKTTNTTDFTSSLISSLLGKLSLQVNVLGLPILVPPGLTGSVSSVLSAALSPVDQLVNTILQTTGLGLGQASTWVNGARCTAGTLAG